MSVRDQQYISEVRQRARLLWDTINALKAMQREWNALDLAANLENGTGDNIGILATDVGAVVFATTDAIIAVLDAGSATNLAKLL